MSNKEILQIPFVNFNKKGIIEVVYEQNTGPVMSGFEIVKELVPDINMCIGYPTLSASVKNFEGFGFSRYCGWIQVITMEFYSDKDNYKPEDIYYEVDVTPAMKEKGIPFFGYGFPAVFYDAPCNNYYNGSKLVWKADTFLITMPSYVNSESISFLAGFQWGFTDYKDTDRKRIEINPIKTVNRSAWESHFDLLKRDFQHWLFI